MKDKFCISKGLVYMMVLVGAIIATFLATNYANNGSLTLNSQAGFTCKQISCGTLVTGATAKFYAKNNGKYYEDQLCNKEIVQGVGNYCKGNASKVCVKKTCTDNPNRVYYQKGTTYYGDSSCTGTIAGGLSGFCAIKPSTTPIPGSGTYVACLNYSCTTVDEEKGVGRNYSVKQGQFYAGTGCGDGAELKALVGIGKYCRGTYVKFSCYNWWSAFDPIDKTTKEHKTPLENIDRTKAVYTNDNGVTWKDDQKGTNTVDPYAVCVKK